MKIPIPEPEPREVLYDLNIATALTNDEILYPDWDGGGWERNVPEELRESWGRMNVWQKVAVALFAELI